ncbi:MAG: N-formylglutamate amidohydrolase, partial [Bdellovibrionales bacterium]|nr:N-formylglutamate amidohydrolase [Bdellovibrionales bacterium]
EDVDKDSVIDAPLPSGSHTTGLHWVKTTRGQILMKEPISKALHEELVKKYFRPFHHSVESMYQKFRSQGFEQVYQIDAHSMPSKGTKAHRDPGEMRAEVVISDQEGKSCEPKFAELVLAAYQKAGFQIKMNWPYVGGRVTQTYGRPEKGQHCIQVELNRGLYMDEETKKLNEGRVHEISEKLTIALRYVQAELDKA